MPGSCRWLRESSLEGGVCWPGAAKEVPGNREMQSSDMSQFVLCCSLLNSLSLFQLACRGFTSSPSASLSVLHALSTASRTRKPPRSVCARRITPGLLQTRHLPPAHVGLAGTPQRGSSPGSVCPEHRARQCPGCPCLLCVSPRVCAGVLLHWGGDVSVLG